MRGYRDDPAVSERPHIVRSRALRNERQNPCDALVDVFRDQPSLGLMLDEPSQGAARLHDLGRQDVHVGVALVANQYPPIAIKHDEALRHVLQSAIELSLLAGQELMDTLRLTQDKFR